MTRKRKNIEESNNDGDESTKRTFPIKSKLKNENNKFRQETYSSTGDYYAEPVDKDNDKLLFPTELVSYMRNFSDLINSEGKLENEVMDKIMEECSGSEELLLKFFDSCKLIEDIFGNNNYGATLFLKSLYRLKHKVLLDLFFSNTSARTIEKLLFACVPITNEDQLNVISTTADLLCDHWNDASSSQPTSFLLRCIVNGSDNILQRVGPSLKDMHFGQELKQIFNKIADVAIENTMKNDNLQNSYCSLTLYTILDCDEAFQGRKCSYFVEKMLSQKGDAIANSFCGKGSSRIWDKAVVGCSEELRRRLWSSCLLSNFERLAMDKMANHPLQNFLKSLESAETARDACECVIPLIPKLFQNEKTGMITAAVLCSQHDANIQEKLIKQLRTQFRAEKASQKTVFFMNILTMNKYDGANPDVNQADLQGSRLLQALFNLTKVKTLSSGILELEKNTIMSMTLNKICAFVVQAILKSQSVDNKVKKHIIESYETKWVTLVEHPIGSRTFDVLWDSSLINIDTKMRLMKEFVGVRNTTKQWKFAMLRCDMNLFRKDRKAWIKNQKEWEK